MVERISAESWEDIESEVGIGVGTPNTVGLERAGYGIGRGEKEAEEGTDEEREVEECGISFEDELRAFDKLLAKIGHRVLRSNDRLEEKSPSAGIGDRSSDDSLSLSSLLFERPVLRPFLVLPAAPEKPNARTRSGRRQG